MKTPLDTRGSRANDGGSARLGKKQPDGTHAHRIAHCDAPGCAWRGRAPRSHRDDSAGQDARDFPVGAQRHAGGAVRLELDAEHLVQLDVVAVEAEP